MISESEGAAFFIRLLQGLLANLQPGGLQARESQGTSPLRLAAKDVLASTCQLLGPERFLQQTLQSVEGIGAAQPLSSHQLEVRCFGMLLLDACGADACTAMRHRQLPAH